MDFIHVLGLLALGTAAFGTYCATRTKVRLRNFKVWDRRHTKAPHLHFLRREQAACLRDAGFHSTVFELQNPCPTKVQRKDVLLAHGISFEELEKCIPWVPSDNKILIVCADGFSPTSIRLLSRLNTSRDLYLIECGGYDALPTELREASCS